MKNKAKALLRGLLAALLALQGALPAYAGGGSQKGTPRPTPTPRVPAAAPRLPIVDASLGNAGPAEVKLSQPAAGADLVLKGAKVDAVAKPVDALGVTAPDAPAPAIQKLSAVAADPAVQAALEGKGEAAEAKQALDTAVDGAAPAAAVEESFEFLPNGEGPYVWHFRYRSPEIAKAKKPGRLPTQEELAGRTPVFVSPGSGYNKVPTFDRTFVRRYLQEAVDALQGVVPGLKLLLVDDATNRPHDVEHFVETPTSGDIEDEGKLREIAAPVISAVKAMNGMIVGSSTVLNPYVAFPPIIAALVRESGMNPNMPANPYEAVHNAQVKSVFQRMLAKYAPWLALPTEVVAYPAEFDQVLAEARAAQVPLDPSEASAKARAQWWKEHGAPLLQPAVERMLATFKQMQAENPGRRFIMRPEKSAGKAAVRDDVGSAEEAAEAYLSLMKEILFTWSFNPKKRAAFGMPERPNIMLQRLIRMHGEYDIETVISPVEDGVLDVKATVIGNSLPAPGTKSEMGMTFPALLSSGLSFELVKASLHMVLSQWRKETAEQAADPKAKGELILPFGNFHNEAGLDNGTTPAPIEVNPTRPVGGVHGVPTVRRWSGINLVLDGILAALNLPLTPVKEQPKTAVVLKKAVAPASGFLRDVVVPEELLQKPWLKMYRPATRDAEGQETWLEVRDPRSGEDAFGQNNTYFDTESDPGQPQEQAIERAWEVLKAMTFVVRTDKNDPATEKRLNGLVEEFHPADAEIRLPRWEPAPVPEDQLAAQEKALKAWMRSPEKTFVIMHSISISEDVTKAVSGVEAYEARNLAEILRARDPRVRVVFVTTKPVAKYSIDQLLARLKPAERAGVLSRVSFVTLDDPMMGSTKPMSWKLLRQQNKTTMARIQDLVKSYGRPAALIPFIVSPTEKRAAMRLGLPLYGAHPDLEYWGSKSGNRKIFRDAKLPVIPGVEDVDSRAELVDAIVKTWENSPALKKVMLKVNQAASGLGNLVVKLPPIDAARTPGQVAENIRELARGQRRQAAETLLKETEGRLVREGMTGSNFIAWMLREGGVVEEFVEDASGAPSPSGQAVILPDGKVELLSTHEQRLDGEGVYLGAYYPANNGYRRTVEAMTRKIGRELSKKGVRGRFGVDYIAIPDSDGAKVLPIEINVRAGGTTHPFVVAQLLTGAKVKNGLLRRKDGRAVVYNASDHTILPKLKGVDVENLLLFLADKDILYSPEKGRGAVFHLLDAIPNKGNAGYTVIAATSAEASWLENRLVQLLNEYAAGGR